MNARHYLVWIILTVTAGLITTSSLRAASPPGDRFADPLELSGSYWQLWLENANATQEAGEQPHIAELGLRRSMWLSWTAPATAETVVNAILLTDNFPFGFLRRMYFGFAVYESGSNIRELKRIAAPLGGHGYGSTTKFLAQGGQTYLLAFDGLDRDFSTGMPYRYLANLFQPGLRSAENDLLTNSIEISKLSSPILFDLSQASLEPDEPRFGTWNPPWWIPTGESSGGDWYLFPGPRGGSSIWYHWRALDSGPYRIDAWMPGSAPQLALFKRAQPGNPLEGQDSDWRQLRLLERIENGSAEHDANPPFVRVAGSARVTQAIQVEAGDEIVIQIDQLAMGKPWNGEFLNDWVQPDYDCFGWVQVRRYLPKDNFEFFSSVENDERVTAKSLKTSVVGRTIGATGSAEDLAAVGNSEHATVWYAFTAEETGNYLVRCEPMYRPVGFATPQIHALRLNDTSSLEVVALSASIMNGLPSIVRFQAEQATVTWLMVSTRADRTVQFRLTIEQSQPNSPSVSLALKSLAPGLQLEVSGTSPGVCQLETSNSLGTWVPMGHVEFGTEPSLVELAPPQTNLVHFFRSRPFN